MLKPFWDKRFYWILGALLALNVGYGIFGYFARRDLDILVLDTDSLVAALKNDEIAEVNFYQETETLDGKFKPQFEGKWKHRRFTYTGKLGAGLYEQIIDKNLSTNPNLGAAAGFDKNPEFEAQAQIATSHDLLQSGPFRVGEREVLTVDFMGLEAGELAITAAGLKTVQGIKTLELSLNVKSRPGFKVYTLNDTATVWLREDNSKTVAAKILFEEANRYGSLYDLMNQKSGQITEWQNYVEKSRGRHKSNETFALQPDAQSPFSAIFALRSHRMRVGESFEFFVQDHNKRISISTKAIRQDLVQTPLGPKASILLECRVRDLSKTGDPGTLAQIWVSDDERQFIIKIQVDLKFGKINAILKELSPG